MLCLLRLEGKLCGGAAGADFVLAIKSGKLAVTLGIDAALQLSVPASHERIVAFASRGAFGVLVEQHRGGRRNGCALPDGPDQERIGLRCPEHQAHRFLENVRGAGSAGRLSFDRELGEPKPEPSGRKVLEDLVKQPAIAKRNYKIIHYDSQDFRGIDVAFLYQEKYFKPSHSKAVPVDMFDESGKKVFSRDVLLVSGDFDGQEMHFTVNHWPSRRGGQKVSAPRRNSSALKNRELADSILAINPTAGIIVMGDLNDDPNNESITKYLEAKSDKKTAIKTKSFYNPYYDLFKKGIGSNAYRDSWSLFDQIIISDQLLNETSGGFHFYKNVVFNKPYLVQKTGQYKGYPFRTFDFDNYISGYSDHLPVYIILVKKI